MEKIKIVFLGTAASTPTKERGLSSVALKFKGEWLLFDCPEGTQRQMMTCGVSYLKIRSIFISHLHADHVLGLAGLIATMSTHQRDYPLNIFGPKGIKKSVEMMIRSTVMNTAFELQFHELKKGIALEEKDFFVRSFPLNHEIECFGFSFKQEDKLGEFSRKKALDLGIPEGPLWGKLQNGETIEVKGKKFFPKDVLDTQKAETGTKISVVFDTRPAKSYFNEIKESDVLIHEATFSHEMLTRAIKTKHSTAQEAGKVAAETACKKLVLTHISARHKEEQKLENEARKEFGDVTVAKDFLEMEA